jgi:hypothetical protein
MTRVLNMSHVSRHSRPRSGRFADRSGRRIASPVGRAGQAVFDRLEQRLVFTALPLGQVSDGQISAAGEVDSWTFAAVANEKLLLNMSAAAVDTGFSARFDLYPPGSSVHSTFVAGSRAVTATVAGTYTVKVHDYSNIHRGNYSIGLEQEDAPSPDAKPLTRGGIVGGSIGRNLQTDQWTFSGSAGNVVGLAATATAMQSGFSGRFDLLDPDGVNVSTMVAGGQRVFTLAKSGTYVVQVHDYGYSHTGSYTVGLEGLKPISPDAKPLSKGGIVSGSINSAIAVDQWTFTGNAGDQFDLNATALATQSGFSARFDLIDPDGVSVDTFVAGHRPLAPLSKSGTYLVQVHDYGYSHTGTYTIGLEGRKPVSPDALALPADVTKSGSISSAIDVDDFTFYAVAGDSIAIGRTALATQSGFSARFTLVDPSGVVLSNLVTGTSSITAASTGWYTMQVHDYGYSHTGTYTLSLRWNSPSVSSISGSIFNDTSGDGARNTGETSLAGWTVWLDDNNNGVLDASEVRTKSDPEGNYAFTAVRPGAHVIRESSQSGWRQTGPGGGKYAISTAGGHDYTGKDFANTQRALVSGTVFNDANGNGIRESAEGGLSGWKVYLDANNNGVWDSTERFVLSDAAGNWSFKDLLPGTSYHVRVSQQTGYTQTTPSGGSFTINPPSGSTATGKLFGEHKVA